jgi:hypothetical protein
MSRLSSTEIRVDPKPGCPSAKATIRVSMCGGIWLGILGAPALPRPQDLVVSRQVLRFLTAILGPHAIAASSSLGSSPPSNSSTLAIEPMLK